MQSIQLKVQGMSCNHCVQTIEKNVGQLDGVSQVQVSLAEGKVTVAFDEAKTSQAQIAEVIDDQGFTVVS